MSARRSQGLPGTKQTNLTIPYREQSIIRSSQPVLTKTYNRTCLNLDNVDPDDCFRVDDSSDFSLEGTDAWSCFVWSKQTVGDAGWVFFKEDRTGTNNRGWALNVTSVGHSRLQLAGDGSSGAYLEVETTTPVATGAWTHHGFTYNGNEDGSGVEVYVNGQPDTKNVVNNTFSGTALHSIPLLIGGYKSTGDVNGAFKGRMTEGCVFSGVLTPAQVSRVYRTRDLRLLPFAPRLLGYWSGDVGDPDYLYDLSGRNNHGSGVNTVAGSFASDAPPGT